MLQFKQGDMRFFTGLHKGIWENGSIHFSNLNWYLLVANLQ